MKKILAIDDSKDNLTTIEAVIKDHLSNCTVLKALSGKSGIEIAKKEKPDTILLDIVMPKMDGYEVCQKLKANQLTKHIPIIMVTALKTDSESRIKGLDLGADAFISKPIDAVELAAQIRVMLRIKDAEDQLRADKKSLEEEVKSRTKKLAENEKQFRLIAENTSDNIGITTFDLKAKYLYVSPSIKQVLGYKEEDLLDKSFFDFVHPEDKKNLYPLLKEYVNQKIKKIIGGKELPTSKTIEFRFKNKKGNWLHIQSALNIVGNKILAVSRDITEQKKSEVLLKESQEMYKALYENAPLPYQSLNEDGSFRDVNPSWLDTLGYKRSEVIGKFYKDFLHPDWHAHFEKNFPEFKKRGYVSDVQFKIRHKKGHYLDISFEGCIGYNPDGSVKQTYCVFKDITEQKKIEQSLLESEEMFRSLVVNSSDLIFLTDPEGKVTFISPQCEAVIGHNLDNIIGITVPDFIHPDDKQLALKNWKNVYDGKKDIREFEYRILDNQDEVRWVSHSTKSILIDGQLKFVQNTVRNITDQKIAENELLASKAHLQTLIETIPDLVWMKDPEGVYLTCNKRFESFFGASKSEIIGKTDYDFVDKELADFFRKNDKAALKAGKALMNEEEVQFANDGHHETLETLKTPVQDKKGRVIGVLGIARNISDRIKTEKELKQSEERYQSFIQQSHEGIYRMEMLKPMDISLPIEEQIDFINENAIYAECNDAFVKMYGAKSAKDILNIKRVDFDKDIKSEQSRENIRTFIKAKYQISNAVSLEKTTNNELKWFSNNTIGIVENGHLVRMWGTQLCISDRKKAEQKLMVSEERYRSLMQNLPVGVFRSTYDGKVLSANPAMAEIYGYNSVDELLKLPAAAYYHKSNPRNQMLAELSEKGFILGRETLEHRKDGSLIWVSANYRASFYETGEIKHLDGVIIDINERKKAEQALNESEKRFKELVELLPEAVIETDKDLNVTYVNKRAYEISGYSEEDFDKGVNGFELLIEEDREKALHYSKLRQEGEDPGTIEYKAIKKDGSIFNVLFHGSPIIKDGKYTGIRAIIVDITNQKMVESKLFESQKQYESLFNQIADPIVVFDKKTKMILHCNSAMIDRYGYSLEEITKMTPLSLHHKSDDMITANKNLHDENDRGPNEYIHQSKNGTVFYVETRTQEIIFDKQTAWITIMRDVTERRKFEDELRKSEQDYRGLFENAHDAIIIFDHEGEIVLDVNDRACEVYGFSKDDFTGMSLKKISVEPLKGEKAIKQTLEKGHYHEFETMQYRKDGKPIIVEVNASVIEYAGKQAILSNNRDITSRKLTEKESNERAEKYRVLYTSTNDAIFLMQDYKFISCNPPTLKMYGCKSKDIIGHTPMEFSPEFQPNGRQSLKMAVKKMEAALSGKPQTFEWLHNQLDGTPFNAEVTLTRMNLSEGEYIHAIVRDISERKRAELVQRALYNISNAVVTSESLESFIKLIRNELGGIIDTTNFFIAFYNEEDDTFYSPYLSDERDKFDTWPAGKTFSSYVVRTQKSLLVSDKDILKMESEGKIEIVGAIPKVGMIVPLKYENKTTGVFAVQSYDNQNAYTKSDLKMLDFVSDQISLSIHRKNAEQNLKDALKKATESDRLKSTFLATMSHELRTPLNAIIGFSDIITKELPIEEIIKFTETINASGNHLLNIVEDLFDITLIESGQIKIIKEDIQLKPILNNVYEIIEAEQKNTNKENIELKLIVPDNANDQTINTDRSKLKQILINLLKNAIKFTGSGQISFGYEITELNKESYLQFFVKDTGIGIRKDQQKLIFEMFRQADETYTTAHGGTGIGLSITKKLTELMGGDIWLESEMGEGSTFFFTIPMDHLPKAKKALDQKGKKQKLLKSKTILIAEDIEASYELLKAMLKSEKMNLIWAKNGEEAVKMCEENPNIDLVLMDINMPIMNGYDATRLIKSKRPDLPVIAQTAYAIIGDREKSIDAGCDDYIAKPIKRTYLFEIIAKYIST